MNAETFADGCITSHSLAPGRFLTGALFLLQRMLKRGVETLKMEDYQILYCAEGLAAGPELERLKVMSSAEHYVGLLHL